MMMMTVRDPVLLAEEHWREHGWNAGPQFLAALSIYRTDDMVRVSNDAMLRPHQLTRSRHEALAVLFFSRRGEMPLSRLSERLLVHPTSVTSTVNTLQRLGFVDRLSHPNDRRSTLARITLKGRRAMKQTTRALAEDRLGLSALDEREAERLFDLLRRVRADAGDLKHAFRRADPEGVAIDPVLVAESNWESRGWVARPHFRAGLSIYHCAELIRQAMTDAMAPHGLTFVLHEALAVLFFSRRGEMPMGKLGDRLLVHPTSVTSTIDRLENLELV
ncbi:MAG: hypothetical protein QOG39_618, partial [Acidimicrobiaceae bacterium]